MANEEVLVAEVKAGDRITLTVGELPPFLALVASAEPINPGPGGAGGHIKLNVTSVANGEQFTTTVPWDRKIRREINDG